MAAPGRFSARRRRGPGEIGNSRFQENKCSDTIKFSKQTIWQSVNLSVMSRYWCFGDWLIVSYEWVILKVLYKSRNLKSALLTYNLSVKFSGDLARNLLLFDGVQHLQFRMVHSSWRLKRCIKWMSVPTCTDIFMKHIASTIIWNTLLAL